MSVLDTERLHPLRSVLRYRPLASDDQAQHQPSPLVARRSRFQPDTYATAVKTIPDDLGLEEQEIQPPRRHIALPAPRWGPSPTVYARQRFHPLFLLGLVMLIMILGWVSFSALSTWWQITQDDWHYGRPRTFQVDQVVGHHDSSQNPSHFIAMNLNRHIIIIELPGGNASKSVIFSGPTLLGPEQDLTPVTLTFQDVNHDGKLDMVVHIQSNELVFLNANGTFVMPG